MTVIIRIGGTTQANTQKQYSNTVYREMILFRVTWTNNSEAVSTQRISTVKHKSKHFTSATLQDFRISQQLIQLDTDWCHQNKLEEVNPTQA